MPALLTRSLVGLVDCASFYGSCERAFRPDLNDTPIVVLSNNDGCIISRTQEAKDLGVPMGAPYFKNRRQLERDGVAVFSSNYALYGDLSRRVMTVLERFSPNVDRSSIDEAFLTFRVQRSCPEAERERIAALAHDIRQTVLRTTGIPVRVSIAETKTLAKAASEYARDHGDTVCFWGHPDREAFLAALPVGDVWGIGPRWARRLHNAGVHTAAAFADLSDRAVRRQFSVVALRTALELRGVPCIELEMGPRARKSLVRSRSFGAKTSDLQPALEAVANHAARAAEKLRAESLAAGALQVFITTGRNGAGPHHYGAAMEPFSHPTASSFEIVASARRLLRACHQPENAAGVPHRYMKAGVILTELVLSGAAQADLFRPQIAEHPALFAALDQVNARFGRHALAVAAQGQPRQLEAGDAAWSMSRQHLSPRYTTRWEDLPVVGLAMGDARQASYLASRR
ncbi:MAG: Y-family DNA polymerase [Rubricoccaceae bacterium]